MSMFHFLVRDVGFEQFSLAMGDGFLCLESTVPCDKWQESEKQPAGLEIEPVVTRQSKALSTK